MKQILLIFLIILSVNLTAQNLSDTIKFDSSYLVVKFYTKVIIFEQYFYFFDKYHYKIIDIETGKINKEFDTKIKTF